MHEPRWDADPGCPQKRTGRILRVTSPERVEVIALTDQVTRVWTHAIPWAGSIRTYPCTGDSRTCWFDHAKTSLRWQGWIAVQKPFGRELLFTALTPSAYREPTLQAGERQGLRGHVLFLARVGMNVNSRLHCICSLAKHTDRQLSPEPDTKAFLLSLWGLPHTWPEDYRSLLPTSSGDDQPLFDADDRRRP